LLQGVNVVRNLLPYSELHQHAFVELSIIFHSGTCNKKKLITDKYMICDV
jgi:hypothetical protein